MAEFEVPKSMAQKPQAWDAGREVAGVLEEAGMGSEGKVRGGHTAGGAIVGVRSRARMRLRETGVMPR